jgi:vanillate O-demethylase ferredoxin subunit
MAPVDESESSDYTVELAKTGMQFEVSSDSTILATLIDAGVDVDYSCEEGTCGACEVKVLAGKVLHRDSVRTPEEHDEIETMMICCSRPRGDRVVIDI